MCGSFNPFIRVELAITGEDGDTAFHYQYFPPTKLFSIHIKYSNYSQYLSYHLTIGDWFMKNTNQNTMTIF